MIERLCGNLSNDQKTAIALSFIRKHKLATKK